MSIIRSVIQRPGPPGSGLTEGQIDALGAIPTGGDDGQALVKTSGTDYDTAWETPELPTTTTGYFDVKAYGAAGDGATDDTAAVQAAIDAAHALTLVIDHGQVVLFPPGIYLLGKLTLKTKVILWGAGRIGGQGGPYGVARWQLLTTGPNAVGEGEYLINQTASLDDSGIIGITSRGDGNGNYGFANLTDSNNFIIHGCYIWNNGGRGLKYNGGILRLSYSFIDGLFDTSWISEPVGAVELEGQDHIIAHSELTGPSYLATSSANLYAHAALVDVGASLFDGVVFQTADIGLGIAGGVENRYVGCRMDTNAAHGLVYYDGDYQVFTGCHFNRNSWSAANTYDHIHVPADGGTRARFIAPMFGHNGSTPRYNIYDQYPNQGAENHYIHPFGLSGVTGFSNVVMSAVVPDANAAYGIAGTTPSVLNASTFMTANFGGPVTITDFTDGSPGQRITIIGGFDSGNTTITHGGTIANKSAANIVMTANTTVQYIRWNGAWLEV